MEPQWVKKGATVLVIIGFLLFFFIPSWRLQLFQVFSLLIQGDLLGLRQYLLSFGLWAPAISALLMVLQAYISPIPSIFLFIVNGALYGHLLGFILSWITSLIAGILCYLTAEALGRPFVLILVHESFLRKIDDFLDHYGRRAVLFARLIPFMPFDLASFAFGLTSISLKNFTLGTAIGQIPAILFYSFLGNQEFDFDMYALWITLWFVTLYIITRIIGSLWRRSHKRH